jgi:regulatory protein
MPKITHMEFKRRRPERFILHWDNGEEHIFSPESMVKYGLVPEREFSEEEYREILKEDGVRRAKDQLLKYLGIRPHSRKELFLKTLRKGYSPDVIETALADLENVELVDDQKFARQFIQNELLLRPCGKNLLKGKLLNKGVAPGIFQPILDEIYGEHPQEEIIKDITQKFLNRNRHLEGEKRIEKLIRHLQSKGFGWDLINWVLYESKMIDTTPE